MALGNTAIRPAWIFEPPRELLFESVERPTVPFEVGLVVLGSLLSFALAERLMFPLRPLGLIFSYFSFLLAFILLTILFYQMSRLFIPNGPGYLQWLRTGAVSILPLNLLLPVAIFLHNGNSGSLILFELAKLAVSWAAFRRWMWGTESLTKWPPWACSLFLLGPFLLASALFIVMVALFASAVAVVFLTKGA